ncbi:hypothetical protein ACIOZM_03360 [Pseudomonas sp. NPDC087346]|uniref:hypothetical protein n=1 Tax=Pseudomonas sp. NPDC087346 TaxID=3364438 RepID=UPI003802EF30
MNVFAEQIPWIAGDTLEHPKGPRLGKNVLSQLNWQPLHNFEVADVRAPITEYLQVLAINRPA